MNIEVRAVPGDKLYLLAAGGRIDEVKVNALYINPHGSVWMHCVKKVGRAEIKRPYPESDIGEKLFESRERVEAAVNGKIIGV